MVDFLSYTMLAIILVMSGLFAYKAISKPSQQSTPVPVLEQEVKPVMPGYSNPAIEKFLPAGSKLEQLKQDPLIIKITKQNGTVEYAAIGKASGHLAEISVLVIINSERKIKDVIVIDQHETPNVFDKLIKTDFFSQFIGKDVSENIVLGQGIDAVSKATNSSSGVTRAVASAVASLRMVPLAQTK